MPVYERLASISLLSRCERKGTQNSNECLHSVIWSRCPKENFYSKDRIVFTVLRGVSEFNFGPSLNPSINAVCGVSRPCNNSLVNSRTRVKKRLYNDSRRLLDKASNRRKKIREAKLRKQKLLEKEEGGPAYLSGAAPLPAPTPLPGPTPRKLSKIKKTMKKLVKKTGK